LTIREPYFESKKKEGELTGTKGIPESTTDSNSNPIKTGGILKIEYKGRQRSINEV